MTTSTASVLSGLDGIRGWVEDLYRDLHAHPQLSHQERRTAHHFARFAPVLQPTPDIGTTAMAVAALAGLGGTTGG